MVDKIPLNESPAKRQGHDSRAEDIRLKCLEIACAQNFGNDTTALIRAKAFEHFVETGEIMEPGMRTQAFTAPIGGWRE
jgi:hypothetical protein